MAVCYKYFFFISLFLINISCLAQSDDYLDELKEISIERIGVERSGKDTETEPQDLPSLDSLLTEFDVDIDMSLGTISLETSWGDPIKNPEIRGNRASNLFGQVRYNRDGSKRWHRGFDYSAPTGTPVLAVGAGAVSLIQEGHPDFGLCILITHKRLGKTYYSFYAHLSSVSVKYGQNVNRGKVIGKSGTTGNAENLSSSEAHLHFEYRTSPKHGDRKQKNPNEIVRTKFYSADPKNNWQANVGVVKKPTSVF